MNIKNINGALFAMALVAASAGFTSCEEEPDKYEVAGGTTRKHWSLEEQHTSALGGR